MDPDPTSALCFWPGVGEPAASPSAGAAATGHPFCLLCDAADASGLGPRPLAADGLPPAARIPLRAGARLFERGTLGQAVYVVQSGLVKETLHGPDGSEHIVRLVARGGVTGLCALLGAPHHHSAYVMHPGTACRVPLARVEELRREHPRAVERLFADWQTAVDDADRIICELGQGPARARLARALLWLRDRLAPAEPLRLRREDLAQLMAVTTGSVARLLADFRREGLIEQQGRQCVGIDRARLQRISVEGG